MDIASNTFRKRTVTFQTHCIIQTSSYHNYYPFIHIDFQQKAILLFYTFMPTYIFSLGELTNSCINLYRNDKTYFVLQYGFKPNMDIRNLGLWKKDLVCHTKCVKIPTPFWLSNTVFSFQTPTWTQFTIQNQIPIEILMIFTDTEFKKKHQINR
jgi:hypothetical protein